MPNIIRLTQYELIRTAIMKEETYLFTTDTFRLYYDDGNTRKIVPYKFVETELQRVREVIPRANLNYYVWETNELWTYAGVWIIKAGSNLTNPSYYHNKDYTISAIDTGYADNNGMLGDGSVIIRDIHKAIKGRIFVDKNNNLVISSFIGGGLTFLPYGVTDTITSVPDPIFKYDEDGNLTRIEEQPDHNMINVGRIDVNIDNTYDNDGAVVSKLVTFKISDMLEMTQNYVYDSTITEDNRPRGWIPDTSHTATLKFRGNIEASGTVKSNVSL